ncbi:hypothetical protein SAMN06265355_11443 [Actinomadura mexicana]|uniref:Uncharacterized protein n=1 Tax=Actinomadura mexicana TaxID=134959 RepID=A0A239D9Q2_9ACTN|nr:hypothetical protein SAMN06265355_11443 [Actinomadura mexicana]
MRTRARGARTRCSARRRARPPSGAGSRRPRRRAGERPRCWPASAPTVRRPGGPRPCSWGRARRTRRSSTRDTGAPWGAPPRERKRWAPSTMSRLSVTCPPLEDAGSRNMVEVGAPHARDVRPGDASHWYRLERPGPLPAQGMCTGLPGRVVAADGFGAHRILRRTRRPVHQAHRRRVRTGRSVRNDLPPAPGERGGVHDLRHRFRRAHHVGRRTPSLGRSLLRKGAPAADALSSFTDSPTKPSRGLGTGLSEGRMAHLPVLPSVRAGVNRRS